MAQNARSHNAKADMINKQKYDKQANAERERPVSVSVSHTIINLLALTQ